MRTLMVLGGDSLTFLPDDWFIGEDGVLLSLCSNTRSTLMMTLRAENCRTRTWQINGTHLNCFRCHCWRSGILGGGKGRREGMG